MRLRVLLISSLSLSAIFSAAIVAAIHGLSTERAAVSTKNRDGATVSTAPRSHLPARFEENDGQLDDRVRFLARTSNASLFLTDDGATLAMHSLGSSHERTRSADDVLRWRVAGARAVAPRGELSLVTKSNYFVGSDPSRFRTDIPNFSRVVYPSVLDGVDLVYHGEDGPLEYDFEVAPSADIRNLTLVVDGADSLTLADDGDLLIRTETGGTWRQPRPKIYQRDGHIKEPIQGKYRVMGGNRFGFEVASYDVARTLVIDPVVAYATYLGGPMTNTGMGEDEAQAIAVDSSGAVYLAGWSASAAFPTVDPIQGSLHGYDDAVVAKLDAGGSTLLYATYLGGDQTDVAYGIAVDAAGNAYIAGQTSSDNFPVAQAAQPTYGGGNFDAFFAKLNPAGNALIYASNFGGAGSDAATSIAVDTSGDAFVVGNTDSPSFPTLNAFQATLGGASDAFLVEISATGAVASSTFLGGSTSDQASAVAVDAAGSAYVVGQTDSPNFPTLGPIQANYGGGLFDGFITKLTPNGSALAYSTYLGGSDFDWPSGVAVDSAGGAHITGYTYSTDFPTHDALQATFTGVPGTDDDVFVTEITPDGGAVVYSTYLSGSRYSEAYGIALDTLGNTYVTGLTAATDFPTQDPFQAVSGGDQDAFVTKLAHGGASLVYSSYLGGSKDDGGRGIAVDASGNAYVAGFALSMNFPTKQALQGFAGGTFDAFVAKIGEVGTGGAGGSSGTTVTTGSSTSHSSGSSTNSSTNGSTHSSTDVTTTAGSGGAASQGMGGAGGSSPNNDAKSDGCGCEVTSPTNDSLAVSAFLAFVAFTFVARRARPRSN